MSEHPLIKHGLKLSRAIKNPTNGWWAKTRTIVIEILIIVFAVSATLYMERWRENQHDLHLEKEFLTDLKDDITIKMKELKQDSTNFEKTLYQIGYLTVTGRGEVPFEIDSVKQYFYVVTHSYYYLNPNDAIFESIKYSGKLSVIRNKELRTNLLDLYQQLLPAIQTLMNQFYYPSLTKLDDFLIKNKIEKKGINNIPHLLKDKQELSNLLENLQRGYGITLNGYKRIISVNRKLLSQIKEELK